MSEIQYTYKLIKGADNTLFVSVGPLMNDIQLSIDKMYDINIDDLSDDDKQIFDLKILGLKTVYEFLGALVMEQTLKDKNKELSGDIPLNTTNNFTVVGASPKVH